MSRVNELRLREVDKLLGARRSKQCSTHHGRSTVVANPKHAQSRRGRHQLSRRGRTSGKLTKGAMEEARTGDSANEKLFYSEKLERPEMAAERMTPQVLGWSTTAPVEQFEKLMQQFWSFGSDGEANRYARALAQTNVEMIGLVGRRSRAYLDLPSHLAECRTPPASPGKAGSIFPGNAE
mgnify:CR=1 FL=1